MPDQTIDPRTEYTSRIEARLSQAADQFQRFRRVGVVRLIFVTVFLFLLWFVYNGISFWWLLLPIAGFLALGPIQQRITDQKRRCERAADLYRRSLERLDDRWAGKGATGERFLDRSHPYAEDLDLFGAGSLFELLSTARTRVGEHTLADWLLGPAPLAIVRER